jgi:hypothetical protein
MRRDLALGSQPDVGDERFVDGDVQPGWRGHNDDYGDKHSE